MPKVNKPPLAKPFNEVPCLDCGQKPEVWAKSETTEYIQETYWIAGVNCACPQMSIKWGPYPIEKYRSNVIATMKQLGFYYSWEKAKEEIRKHIKEGLNA